MRKRTKAREYALQMLYQIDLRHADSREVVVNFWNDLEEETPEADDVKAFANQLVLGTSTRLAQIDPLIATHADNWDMKRMAVIDRNILRLGVYELLHLTDVPPKVSLNEAVELAKRFGDAESGRFINGILDTIHKTYVKRDAPPVTPSPGGDGQGGGA
jgi:N utilization substance protein B